jgi:cytochrome c oxidase subunit 2
MRRGSPPAPGRALAVAALAGGALVGCRGAQAVLDAQGTDAHAIAATAWVLFAGGAVLFVAVLVAIALVVRGPESVRRFFASDRTILAFGVGLPLVTLTVLLVRGLRLEAG